MITTRAEAEALHAAIEARDDAWNRFHNAALMPAHQTPDDRLAATANNWIAADAQVRELAHGVALVQTDGLPEPGAATEGGGTTAAATVKPPAKRRGRPPKAKTPEEKAATPGAAAGTGAQVAEPGASRTEEDVRAEAEAAAAAGPDDPDFIAGGSNPQPGDAE